VRRVPSLTVCACTVHDCVHCFVGRPSEADAHGRDDVNLQELSSVHGEPARLVTASSWSREKGDGCYEMGCQLASLFTAFVADAALPLPVPGSGLSGRDPAAGASKFQGKSCWEGGALYLLCELKAPAAFDVGGAESPKVPMYPCHGSAARCCCCSGTAGSKPEETTGQRGR
jgi:hypothetical protein